MSNPKKSSARNIIVLTAISIIAALSLAITFATTKEKIGFSERQQTLKSVQTVMPRDKDGKPLFRNEPDRMQFNIDMDEPQAVVNKTLAFYPALDDKGEIIGFAIKITSKTGYAGNIDFMVGIDPDGKIFAVDILSLNETPGLGSKIKEDSFKGQFSGKSLSAGNKIVLKKDNKTSGDIDAISGATISSRAITNAVRTVLEYYIANKNTIISKGKGSDLNPSGQLLNR